MQVFLDLNGEVKITKTFSKEFPRPMIFEFVYIIFLGLQLHCGIIKFVSIKIWNEIICFRYF